MNALHRIPKKGLKTTGNAGKAGPRLQSRFDQRHDFQALRPAGSKLVFYFLHSQFQKMRFPFELLSDPDAAVCKQFSVMKLKNIYRKKVRGIERCTFVVDAKGVLAREWRGVKVPGHAQEVLNFVKAL
jgi:AhpC/TSA family protein